MDDDELDAPSPPSHFSDEADSLWKQLASRHLRLNKPQEKKTPRKVTVKLSVTETDFVVLEDITTLDSNAVVLKVILNEAHHKECGLFYYYFCSLYMYI